MTDHRQDNSKTAQELFRQINDLNNLSQNAQAVSQVVSQAVRLAGANSLTLSAMIGEGALIGVFPPADTTSHACARQPAPLPKGINPLDVMRCHVTERLVAELFASACERDLPKGAAQRRPRCHTRQIAMYLSHVVLSLPYRTIAHAFGRDRTTVVHACSVVEDRRDDEAYDRFVSQCERCINAVFVPFGGNNDIA